MGILSSFKRLMDSALRSLGGSAEGIVKRFSGKRGSPLADRLLSDAVRFAELPSPTEREERRAAFALERLGEYSFQGTVDDDGNILVRISSGGTVDHRPILLFADLGTTRWNPLGSLARVDPDIARGAGLADSLGAAALLSIAEGVCDGSIRPGRDIVLLFAARSLDDPRSGVFARVCDDATLRPAAAIGLSGLGLGSLGGKPLGTYRISVQARIGEPTAGDGAQTAPRNAVSVMTAVAQRIGGIRWDAEGKTACRVRRIEAGTGFGRFPAEGVADIELESGDAAVLDMAMKAVTATAQTIGVEAGAQLTVSVVGHVPVGDPTVGAPLRALAKEAMKTLKIKPYELPGADSASFLSARGVPAIALGIALGKEGLETDDVVIASLESGRRLLAELVERVNSVEWDTA